MHLAGPAVRGARDGSAARRSPASTPSALKDIAFGDFELFAFKGSERRHRARLRRQAGRLPDAAKKYPVAFLIHGGPQGSFGNGWSYRWNPQTYAGQGFAVVMIDFHGSTGYGQAFTDAISGDWGGTPLEDLQKGWAAALGKYAFLDGDRACALGACYGGYMINWIAGNWPQPWKCLVTHDGIFDARMMAYSTEELWFNEWENGGRRSTRTRPTTRSSTRSTTSASGACRCWSCTATQDFRIPYDQGIAAFTALQRRGIESQLLHFPDENHWVLKPQNSVLWHDTVNAWLKKWTAKAAQ